MKKDIYKIIWISGVFLTLILVLLMVLVYKIKYQDAIYYKYLYFYNCNYDVCATNNDKQIEDKSQIYSIYKYQKDTPKFEKLNDEYVKIYDFDRVVLFSMHDRIISNNYKNYFIINNNDIEFVAEDENGKKGLLDKRGNRISGFIYSKFYSYNDKLIVAVYNRKYGIITLDGKNTFLNFEYDNIKIYNDYIVTVKDKTIDIINEKKESFLNKKIEIENIKNVTIEKRDNNIIIKENKNYEFSEYKFDITKKALV